MSPATLNETPKLNAHALTTILSDIKEECSGLDCFVEELLTQFDVLRGDIDRKSKQLDSERDDFAKAHELLLKQHEELAELMEHGGDVDVARLSEFWQQRAELEEELRLARRRAAEMSNTLSKQQREIAEERADWSRELTEMRQMLERQPHMLADGHQASTKSFVPEFSETPPTVQTRQSHGSNNSVINSVMAQFAKLQKDAVARRRKA